MAKNNEGAFRCPNCGLMVQNGSQTCPYCGTRFDEQGRAETNAFSARMKYFLKRNRPVVAIALAIIIIGVGAVLGVNYFTMVDLPDLSGMKASEAKQALLDLGFEERDLYFECQDGYDYSKITDFEYEEYVVKETYPRAGKRVHKGDFIMVTCQDNAKERIRELTDSRYKPLSEAIAAADKLGYTYTIANISNEEGFAEEYAKLNSTDKSRFYVYELSDIQGENKTVTIVADTRKNIKAEMARLFSDCFGEKLVEAQELAKYLGCDIICVDADTEDVVWSDKLIVTDFVDFDFRYKTVTLMTKEV